MFLMGIFWYHLYDMSNYKLCNLDTYNHNFGSRVGTLLALSYYQALALPMVRIKQQQPTPVLYIIYPHR